MATLGLIEYSDNEGSGSFSYIDRICGVNELTPGTYYVQVDENGDNQFIQAYDMSLTASACFVEDPIFDDGFDSGNTSAWALTVP